MSVRAVIVTLGEFIECAVKVGLSEREARRRAREHGYRFDNGDFHAAYAEARARWPKR